jgi:hypothetical protein
MEGLHPETFYLLAADVAAILETAPSDLQTFLSATEGLETGMLDMQTLSPMGDFHPEALQLLTADVAARLETGMLDLRTLSTMGDFHPEALQVLMADVAARLETGMLELRTLSTMGDFHPETIRLLAADVKANEVRTTGTQIPSEAGKWTDNNDSDMGMHTQ